MQLTKASKLQRRRFRELLFEPAGLTRFIEFGGARKFE